MTEIIPRMIRAKAHFLDQHSVEPTHVHLSEDIYKRLEKGLEDLRVLWPNCPACMDKFHGMVVVQVEGTNVIEVK